MTITDITESPADKMRRFARMIIRIRELHRPFRIYEPCAHEHEDADIVNCREFISCEAGYMYSVCAECCCTGGDQTEECADGHEHDDSQPLCATRAALDEPAVEVTTSA